MSNIEPEKKTVNVDRLEAFYKTIVSTMKSGLAIFGSDHTLSFANDAFYEFYGFAKDRSAPITLVDILPSTVVNGFDVQDQVKNLRSGDSPLEFRGLKLYMSPHEERTINVHASPIVADSERSVLLLIDNVTASTQRANQVSMLKKIGEMMHGTLELEPLLHASLTCVTAGSGLGFSRAMLLMVSDDREILEGKMAVGPATQGEATQIWSLMAEEDTPIEQLVRSDDPNVLPKESLLNQTVRAMKFSMYDYSEIAVVTALERKVHIIRNGSADPRVSDQLVDQLGADEFAVVPIVARDSSVGVIIADNRFSGRPIDDETVELLTMFANQAGMAIENAKVYENLREQMAKLRQAYEDLSQAQDRLIRAERLAAIGEMAARVAHEIRNPLVTVGGFARSLRKYHDGHRACNEQERNRVRHELDIIIEEVRSLEGILAKVIDFSRPDTPMRQQGLVNNVLDDTVDLLVAGASHKAIEIEKRYAADLPVTYFDVRQIRQVFFNLIQNAMDAMPGGGRVRISTALLGEWIEIVIQDEGEGIPPDHMRDLFSPFFTTKVSGTGLGLPVVRKIVSDHGGSIQVESEPDRGTAFIVKLPVVTSLADVEGATATTE